MSAARKWPAKPTGSRWTDQQWMAVAADGANLLVAAAAGSGKTAVLVERIISRIADDSQPLDVDALLVATFTKAAAAEMKERIRSALEEAIERNPESRHLQRQLALLPRAAITTLHSFCLEIVRRYAPLIDLDPGFRMSNDTDVELLRIDTLDELFEELYESEGPEGPLAQLSELYGGERSDEALHKLVLELHEFAGSHPWPEHWLREMAAQFETADAEGLLHSRWLESLKGDAELQLQGALQLLQSALRLAEGPGGPQPYAETLIQEAAAIALVIEAFQADDWSGWQAAVRDMSFGRLKPCKGSEYEPELIERAKGLRDSAKKLMGKLAEEWLVRTPETYAQELQQLAPQLTQLVELTIAFGRKFEQVKRAKGVLDFSDLEHYALRILRAPGATPTHSEPSVAALDYQAQFAEIYLDEYQDTNEVQEAIVRLLARKDPGNIFMVGDVKQSIYRFRLAEPGLFMHKYKKYEVLERLNAQEDVMQREPEGLRIDLARNFRSRRGIIEAVNHVFRLIMREPVGEMDYDSRAELVYGDGYPETAAPGPYTLDMIVLNRAEEVSDADPSDGAAAENAELSGDDDGPSADEEELEATQLEARCIAVEIRKLMGTGAEDGLPFPVYDNRAKLHRPVQYRDIVILLRAVSSVAPAILEELKAAGIPAYAELATGYFAATEVDVMISLLSIIDNPHQDIPLAGVLRSPIIGLDAEQLARIRLRDRKGSFWDAVLATVGETAADTALVQRLTRFVRNIDLWRDYARREPLGELIWMLYRETGYYDFVGGLPGGLQRQANLRALVNRATEYEKSSRFRGLFRFLRFLGRMRDSGVDLGAARALGESENVVRIISIHRSKGLEFPVVFAAGLGRQFNRRDLHGSFLKHKQLGFGPRMVELDKRVDYPTLPQIAIRRKLAAEMLAEEMRVLYVALTRPKEKLILIGTSKDAEKQLGEWREIASMAADGSLPPYFVAAASCYLDWLGPAAVLSSALPEPTRRWQLRTIHAREFKQQHASAQLGGQIADDQLWSQVLQGGEVARGDTWSEVVDERLSWKYPYEAATRVPSKSSITALKNRAEAIGRTEEEQLSEEEELVRLAIGDADGMMQSGNSTFQLRRPKFMAARKLSPAERGVAYHLIMQHLPLRSGGLTRGDIEDLLQSLEARQIISSSQRESVHAGRLAAFSQTALYERMCAADHVWRELPFTFGMAAGSAYPDLCAGPDAAGETVIIQGVIDCLFAENGSLVLVDYKTDSLHGQSGVEAAECHRFQLEKYREAVESMIGLPVAETYVYFDYSDETIRLN